MKYKNIYVRYAVKYKYSIRSILEFSLVPALTVSRRIYLIYLQTGYKLRHGLYLIYILSIDCSTFVYYSANVILDLVGILPRANPFRCDC